MVLRCSIFWLTGVLLLALLSEVQLKPFEISHEDNQEALFNDEMDDEEDTQLLQGDIIGQ